MTYIMSLHFQFQFFVYFIIWGEFKSNYSLLSVLQLLLGCKYMMRTLIFWIIHWKYLQTKICIFYTQYSLNLFEVHKYFFQFVCKYLQCIIHILLQIESGESISPNECWKNFQLLHCVSFWLFFRNWGCLISNLYVFWVDNVFFLKKRRSKWDSNPQ